MVPPTSPTGRSFLKELRPRLLRQIQAWRRRSGLGGNLLPEEILEQCLGHLWLILAAQDDRKSEATRALRSALYYEFEKPARLQGLPLLAEPSAMAPAADSETPYLPEWIQQFMEEPARLQLLRKRYNWTRRQLKVHLTAWLLHSFGDSFFQDLKRRHARLATRAAQDGPTPKVIKEARLLHRFTGQLDLPPHWKEIRLWLRTLARQKAPSDPGSRECANE